jgi:hypothetical protein
MSGRRWCLTLLVLAASAPGGATAEVAAHGPDGFVITHEMVVEGTPMRAFDVLTGEVNAWWNADHSYSGDAENLSLDARAGGCFCERLADGGSVEHMRVVFASPGQLLRMVGGLGPLQGMGASGAMDFALSSEGEGQTRLRFRYTVSGFAPDGLGSLAAPVDAVLGGQLARLAAYLKEGTPTGDVMP